MNFFVRLSAAVSPKTDRDREYQRGRPPGKVLVDRKDLLELLYHFERLDRNSRRHMNTYYTTKYALTADGGISISVLKTDEEPQGGKYVYTRDQGLSSQQYVLGRTAFLTREAAIANCEKQRTRAIAAAERKIAKLKAMVFE